MSEHPISVEQARAIDRDAVDRLGMPSILLMENASRAVAERARTLGDRFVVLCGPGNNGGDGLAAARHLGPRARVLLLAEPDPDRAPDAALQFAILRAAGVPIEIGGAADLSRDRDAVWIDAMFGTGLTRALAGRAAEWVEAFNAADGPKLAVDIPSGLHGDTGRPLGPTCRADVTVTFEAPKLGLVADAAREYVGDIVVAPLGLPRVD
ncbi:MAG: NAD(P)H-hydrate epimerase [Planctomycetes bacterium]|nr:NAD(P)H-hydrate epimerase [Planctomycetota bacterium]